MALLDSELRRIKYELGYNVLDVGAEPYIGVHAVFDQVIQTYMNSGATTTSTTVVVVASEATPVTLTLASGTDFTAGVRVIIDVDSRQEEATVQSIAGADITVLLKLAHTGTYPVTVEDGESIVRSILRSLDKVSGALSGYGTVDAAGLSKVDEIEFKHNSQASRTLELQGQQSYWRDELASVLGVVNLRSSRSSAGSTCSLY